MPHLSLSIRANDFPGLRQRQPVLLLLSSTLETDGGYEHDGMKTEGRRVHESVFVIREFEDIVAIDSILLHKHASPVHTILVLLLAVTSGIGDGQNHLIL